jgi:hypothetical protein
MNNFDVDALQLYFGDDNVINHKIKIHQPTLGELIDYGEADYFSAVYTLCAIPSDMKSQLADMGLDWNEVDDFDLFIMLSQTLTPDRTCILFGDLDFSKMKPYRNQQNDEIVLADKESGVKIDKLIYMKIVDYIRKLHGIKPKVEKTKSKVAKKWMIEEDRQKRQRAQDKPFKSYLLPMISSVKVKQGYTKDYMRNMGLAELFDEVARLQILHSSDHLMSAVYAGTVDMKKLDKKELNWMRELD